MSRAKPKLSIIMAEYNTKDEYLRLATESILGQSYDDFEFIIVDDRGKNDVEKLVKEYNDQRIRVIKNDTNKGFVYSLNRAIVAAQGDYLVRMDTDDISTPNRIEVLYNFIRDNPQYDVVSSRAVEFEGDEEFGVIGSQGEKLKKNVMLGDMPVHAASIMKTESIRGIGGYKDYKRAEDLALWCELLLAGKRLYMLNDVLYKYRVNKDDYKKRTITKRSGEIKARLHYYPLLGAGPLEYGRVIKTIVAGLMSPSLVRLYRKKFVVKGE